MFFIIIIGCVHYISVLNMCTCQ